jgi:hypothetical protein
MGTISKGIVGSIGFLSGKKIKMVLLPIIRRLNLFEHNANFTV